MSTAIKEDRFSAIYSLTLLFIPFIYSKIRLNEFQDSKIEMRRTFAV
ncbi:hypothetical protein DSM03_103537 [Leeuwenhoekiella aestuarii]|uniref:Uncharacterized protein n=1 Tax=Leeuwenhoekiella aestuarii TaxID=2249426 RepID=A0A4Q0NXN7_9FLAO|nr:hypothetical protein [Leeuwenhoekiella aestuarii]RXG16350.1 hypothetical protein DSM03_103537 [Leeuwenhoekiella aestuarii]RXG17043.1 hypothetical protein DSM04_102626 [Leeuwenhoekiella aestuarii]